MSGTSSKSFADVVGQNEPSKQTSADDCYILLIPRLGEIRSVTCAKILDHLNVVNALFAVSGLMTLKSYKSYDGLCFLLSFTSLFEREKFFSTMCGKRSAEDDIAKMRQNPTMTPDLIDYRQNNNTYTAYWKGPEYKDVCCVFEAVIEKPRAQVKRQYFPKRPTQDQLVVKLSHVRPSLSDEIIKNYFSKFGNIADIIRDKWRNHPTVENGNVFIYYRGNLTVDFIKPTVFLNGNRITVNYRGQWDKIPCINCGETGHFSRQCEKQCKHCNGAPHKGKMGECEAYQHHKSELKTQRQRLGSSVKLKSGNNSFNSSRHNTVGSKSNLDSSLVDPLKVMRKNSLVNYTAEKLRQIEAQQAAENGNMGEVLADNSFLPKNQIPENVPQAESSAAGTNVFDSSESDSEGDAMQITDGINCQAENVEVNASNKRGHSPPGAIGLEISSQSEQEIAKKAKKERQKLAAVHKKSLKSASVDDPEDHI